MDDKPFIVMPYLKNGNVRDYIRRYPDCDRLLIVSQRYVYWSLEVLIINGQLHHISLGVAHLHSLNIVHGDLKAVRNRSILTVSFEANEVHGLHR